MPTITSPHSLFRPRAVGGPTPETAATRPSQSRYCYLFPDLARNGKVGCFQGTTPAETFAQLRAFEKASRTPLNEMRVMPMALAPAYTYFGQFVNHDISAPVGDVITRPEVPAGVGVIGTTDPAGLDRARRGSVETILENFINEQPSPLSLDSLYGDGNGPRSADPEIRKLYEPDGKRFRLARTRREADGVFAGLGKDPARIHHETGAADIPRQDHQPMIADRRNDENLIVSQLHLALMLFHNKAVAALEIRFRDPARCFAEARKLVMLHYHWLILHDFLKNLLSQSVLATPLDKRPQRQPAITAVPLEFTTAAFRFGHSMVAASYDYNANFGVGGQPPDTVATLPQLFAFTTHRNMGQSVPETLQLPDHWVIDWERMSRPGNVNGPANGPANGAGGAEKIDLSFAPQMLAAMNAPEIAEHGSILFRNIMRGYHRRIPFGQVLAREYGVTVLDEAEIRSALPDGHVDGPASPTLRDFAAGMGMLKETPAWLYFLCEAMTREAGDRIGPTASHIIADTITGLMRLLPHSVLSHANGTWHPRQSPLTDGQPEGLTTIGKLLQYAVKDTRA